MSDYAFFLNRAREAAGVAAQLEAAFARDPSDRGLRLSLRTAVRLAERAEQELYEVAATEQVDVVRYRLVRHISDTYAVHGVSRSLELFQESVSYIYEAIIGQPRIRAGLSREAKKDSELQFAYSYAGSLGIVLLAPSSRGLFTTKFDEVVGTINHVFEINDHFELRDAAKKIGPAAVRKLFEWSSTNFSEGYDLDLRWTNCNSVESGRYLAAKEFGALADLISLTSDVKEKTFVSVGLLVGFDSVFKTFHFVEPDGESYKGHIANEFPNQHDWTVNRRYTAVLTSEVTTRFSTGEETTKYRLASLKPVAS
jgi:hypothetical protein